MSSKFDEISNLLKTRNKYCNSLDNPVDYVLATKALNFELSALHVGHYIERDVVNVRIKLTEPVMTASFLLDHIARENPSLANEIRESDQKKLTSFLANSSHASKLNQEKQDEEIRVATSINRHYGPVLMLAVQDEFINRQYH